MSFFGSKVLRREDAKFLTEGARYVADLDLPDVAWVTYVRSTIAHARVEGIDVAEARMAPGVFDVVTAADIDLEPMPPRLPMINQLMARPFLAGERVRFVGEPLAAIVSATREQGADAAELVITDYEPLHPVIDLEEAQRGETLLFDEAGTNVCFAGPFEYDDSVFDECDVVVNGHVINQRLAPCPLEGRAAAAVWEPDGRLHFYVSTQAPHAVRAVVAKAFSLEPEQVRVTVPDVGGGFGAKGGGSSGYPEELLVAWLARRVGRPCRWVETRSESMLSLGHGRAQIQDFTLGGTADGKLLAYRLELLQDCGAYPSLGALLPTLTKMMACGTYDIPKVEVGFASVTTNTVLTTAYRGAGRPEATLAIELALDRFAAATGIDPTEVRRRNLIASDQFPFTTPTGATYDSGNYPLALDLLLESSGYDELRAEQRRRRSAGGSTHMGIGVAMYVEVTNGGAGGEFGSVEVGTDGKVIVRTGSSPHGQGHVTAWSMIAADALGVELEDIVVLHGDTDEVPRGVGTFGSRSLQVGGTAIYQAAGEVVEKAKGVAAAALEADPVDIVFAQESGAFHVAGVPSVVRTWRELAVAARDLELEPLAAAIDFVPTNATFPFGCHLAVVDVDEETGKVHLRRMIAVDDAGRILNPLLAEGQVHGGLAQGIAQALFEEFVYDEEGNPLTTNFADYSIISAAELPSYETRFIETPTPLNVLGAKGIGESGTIGAIPAVQNAVVDALSHLGVRHVDMPATPERVWRAIQAAKLDLEASV